MQVKKTAAAVVAGLSMVVLVATPAIAEGSWSSNISNAVPGFESRTWQDNNLDNVSTTVGFSGCSLDFGQTFSTTQLEMWGEFGGFPDQNLGNVQNTCGTSDWGIVSSNAYHFRVNTINYSTDASIYQMDVSSVYTAY